jgi:hypothetical protein
MFGEIGETQIEIFSSTGLPPCDDTYQFIGSPTCPSNPGDEHLLSVLVKPGEYSHPSFHFEVSLRATPLRSLCVRLFDVTAGSAVPGSQVCRVNSDPNNPLSLRVRTSPWGTETYPCWSDA